MHRESFEATRQSPTWALGAWGVSEIVNMTTGNCLIDPEDLMGHLHRI